MSGKGKCVYSEEVRGEVVRMRGEGVPMKDVARLTGVPLSAIDGIVRRWTEIHGKVPRRMRAGPHEWQELVGGDSRAAARRIPGEERY